MLTDNSALVATTSPKTSKKNSLKEDDWILVDDQISGRSSPVIVPNPEILDLDGISTTSVASSVNSFRISTPLNPSQLRHDEAKRQAKSIVAQRIRLEQKLFEEPSSLRPPVKIDDIRAKTVTNQLTASKLKRSTAAGHVASETKIKQRSKKGGKLLAGRNNDRKVNNLN